MRVEATYCDGCSTKLITYTYKSALPCNKTMVGTAVENHEIFVEYSGLAYVVCPDCANKLKEWLEAHNCNRVEGNRHNTCPAGCVQVEDCVFHVRVDMVDFMLKHWHLDNGLIGGADGFSQWLK